MNNFLRKIKLFCLLHILLRIKYVPLQRCFAKGTYYIAQFLRRTTTSQEERTSMSCTMELCALSADFTLVHEGCGRPVGDKVWGLRFLYAFELVLSPQNLDERINNKYKIQ